MIDSWPGLCLDVANAQRALELDVQSTGELLLRKKSMFIPTELAPLFLAPCFLLSPSFFSLEPCLHTLLHLYHEAVGLFDHDLLSLTSAICLHFALFAPPGSSSSLCSIISLFIPLPHFLSAILSISLILCNPWEVSLRLSLPSQTPTW